MGSADSDSVALSPAAERLVQAALSGKRGHDGDDAPYARWFRAMIRHERKAAAVAAEVVGLKLSRLAMLAGELDAAGVPLTREEVVHRASSHAAAGFQPVVSASDVVWAILDAIAEPVGDDAPRLDPDRPTEEEAAQPPERVIPASEPSSSASTPQEARTGQPADPIEERRRVLEDFVRALGQESHILRERPAVLWQQLFNRLQWDEEPVPQVLSPALAQRSVVGAVPWIRTKTLPRESGALVRSFTGHRGRISSCASSPDGRFILSAGADFADLSLRLWDVKNGLEVLEIWPGKLLVCAFSPDGRFVVSGTEDGTVMLWDVDTGAELRTLKANGYLTACAVSPDARFVLAGGVDDTYQGRTLKLWDVSTGAELGPYEGAEAEVNQCHVRACAFSPDGCFIVSAHGGGTVWLWDLMSGKKLRKLPDFPEAFSPDGRFAVSPSGNTLKLWDPKSGNELRVLTVEGESHPERYGGSLAISACAVSPNGRWIVSACNDTTLRLVDAESGVELGKLMGHESSVSSCAFSPDGRFVVSSSDDATLKLWDVERAVELGAQTGGSAVSSNESCVRASNEVVRIVRPRDEDQIGSDTSAVGHDREEAVDPHWRYVVALNGAIRLMDRETYDQFIADPHASRDPDVGAVSPEGREVRVGGSGLGARDSAELDGRSPNEPVRHLWLRDGDGSMAFAFSPNGRPYILAAAGTEVMQRVGDEDEVTRFLKTHRRPALWDFEGGAEPVILDSDWDDLVESFAFSPDGQFFVWASYHQATPGVRDTQSGVALRELHGHTSRVSAFAFSPDGHFIVSVSDDQTLKLWDFESGTELATLPIAVSVGGIAFHPASPQFACSVPDKEATLLRLDAASLGQQAWDRQICDLFGIEYGPIVVTAVDRDGDLAVRCPGCLAALHVNRSQLGTEMPCSQAGCGARLRLNSFALT